MSKMNPYPVFQKRGANYDTIHDESTITAKSNARYRYSVWDHYRQIKRAPHPGLIHIPVETTGHGQQEINVTEAWNSSVDFEAHRKNRMHGSGFWNARLMLMVA